METINVLLVDDHTLFRTGVRKLLEAEDDPILKDYNPVTESGNAFLYKEDNLWLFYAALVRALENYKFSYDWQNLELAAMETLAE